MKFLHYALYPFSLILAPFLFRIWQYYIQYFGMINEEVSKSLFIEHGDSRNSYTALEKFLAWMNIGWPFLILGFILISLTWLWVSIVVNLAKKIMAVN